MATLNSPRGARPTAPPPQKTKDVVESAVAWVNVHDSGYLRGFLRGIVDSLNIPLFLSYCLRTNGVLIPAAQCFAMNTVLILSILALTSLTKGTFLEWVVLVSWTVPMRLFTDICGVYGYALYPPIFHGAAAERNRVRQTTPKKVRFTASYVGEKMLRLAMQICATIVKVLVAQLPTVLVAAAWVTQRLGFLSSELVQAIEWVLFLCDWLCIFPLCLAIDSFVYSFFCFESRLEQQGTIDRQGVTHPFRLSELLSLFERAWPYYIGYGFVQHVGQRLLIMKGLPLWASFFYAGMMPINVLTSLEARPGPRVGSRFPLFLYMCRWLRWLCLHISSLSWTKLSLQELDEQHDAEVAKDTA